MTDDLWPLAAALMAAAALDTLAPVPAPDGDAPRWERGWMEDDDGMGN